LEQVAKLPSESGCLLDKVKRWDLYPEWRFL